MNKQEIQQAAAVIKKGGLVLFPSDTVYILAVDPTNQKAVDKLLAFKERWVGKAISVAVADQEMAEEYVELSENARQLYKSLLPGPFTIVSKGRHKVADGIEAENGTLGIRIPDNDWIHKLVTILGKPVTATSANLSGRTPNYSVASLWKTLSEKKKKMIDYVVDAGKLPKNKPSTVIEATEPELKVLRRGDLVTTGATTIISKSETETQKVAEFLLKRVLKGKMEKPIAFLLSGDLGCGKTIFSKAVGKVLGIRGRITSPTFVIYNEYEVKDGAVNKFLHFDLYRITADFELKEIKFWELFTTGTIACIEWPENMGEENLRKLKEITKTIPVTFSYVDPTTREIKYELS
ncbi:L-threonylcarbamoyladenylate synthase [Patescibacteria group bacterium]|nr:L-threonylcarbamoyladenylate synthase [Patescibacteria group bacterium]